MSAVEPNRLSPRWLLHHLRWPGLRLRVPLPFAALAVGLIGALLLATMRPPPDRAALPESIPLVTVAEVHPEALPVVLRSQGTVEAGAEIDLVAELPGPILQVSPELEAGGRFEQGALLVTLDPAEAEIALRQATAVLQLAVVERRKAEAERNRLRALADRGIARAAKLEDAEFATGIARARVDEARARRSEAERRLSLTEIRAPFAGRVRAAQAHAGQFVERRQHLARIYPTDEVEVRLSLGEADLALLGPAASEAGPVRLRDRAGRTWEARIVRVEGVLDDRSRMAHVRARLQASDDPPPIGAFVHAEIEGPLLSGMTALARSSLTEDGNVLVVDDDQRLEARAVEVARVDGDQAWIRKGLEPGEKVAVSAAFLVPGRRVQPLDGARPLQSARPSRPVRSTGSAP